MQTNLVVLARTDKSLSARLHRRHDAADADGDARRGDRTVFSADGWDVNAGAGLKQRAVAGDILDDRRAGGTRIFCSPSLYLSVSNWP